MNTELHRLFNFLNLLFMGYPNPIQKLIDQFLKFPTVGPRLASRFVFYLLSLEREELENIIDSIKNLKKEVAICSSCFNPFERIDNFGICPICHDQKRDGGLLCVVEKEADLQAVEKIKKYQGLYFILGGLVQTLRKDKSQNIRLEELKERIGKDVQIKEVILAVNPTVEGETTIYYLTKFIKETNPQLKITKLGRGLPVGGELEYADEETISSALEGRG